MVNVDRVVFHNRIKALRKAKKLTLQDVASAAGISVTYLSMIEKGKRVPKDTHLRAVAGALGVTAEELRVSADVRTERRLWKHWMEATKTETSDMFLLGRKLRLYRQSQNLSVRALCDLPRSQAVNLQAWRVREFELGSMQPGPEDFQALSIAFGFDDPAEFRMVLEAVSVSLDSDIEGPEGLAFRRRAVQRLRAEGERTPPAFASHLFSEGGLSEHQWIIDGALLEGPDAFAFKNAQILLDNSVLPADGDLVICMRGFTVVGLGRMNNGTPETSMGGRLEGDPWRVIAVSYL